MADRPISKPAGEQFDASRSLAFGRYLVDSYQAGEKVAAEVDRTSTKAPSVTLERVWHRFEVRDTDMPEDVRVRAELEAILLGLKLDGTYGLLVQAQTHAGWSLLMTSDRFKQKHVVLHFGPQKKRRLVGIGPKGELLTRLEEMLPEVYSAATVTEQKLPLDKFERKEHFTNLFGPRLRTEIRDSIDPTEEMHNNILLPSELDEIIEKMVEEEIDAFLETAKDATTMLRIDWGDITFNVALERGLADQIGWNGSAAPVLPATIDTERPARMPFGTGGEGGGEARKGKSGGSEAKTGGNKFGTSGDGSGSGTATHIFPSFGEADAFVCEPFLGAEPELDTLEEGAGLQSLVAEIAERLDMAPCGYPATFCVGAARALAGRAAAVGMYSGISGPGELTLPASARGGNLGRASFRPTASRGIQLLRRLSQAAAKVAELRRLVESIYINGSGRHALRGDYASNPVGWARRFLEEVTPELKLGVGEIFAQTCQLVMLQLLDTSAQQIAARKTNIKAYAPLFRDVLVRKLANVGKLTTLRDRLKAYQLSKTLNEALGTPAGSTAAAVALPGWSDAARALASACVATEGFSHMPGGAEKDIVVDQGVTKIRDEHGFLWTLEALAQEIISEKGQAESIDPLIQQLSDIPENVERFRRNPAAVEPFLEELLDEMARLNKEKRFEAMLDWRFGLRVGKISEDVEGFAVAGVTVQLAGVHLLAHEQIFPFFGGQTNAYADGLNEIFSIEMGIQGFEQFFTFTGMILLAVICAPAAVVAGAAIAAHEVHKAEERIELYKSLINPELVLNRAELEMERYIAYVGFALSLLPEAGTAARAVSVGIRGAAKKGVGVGLRLAGRSVVRHISRQVTEQLAKDMLPALLNEIATNLLMEKVVVPQVVGPIIAKIEQELVLRISVGGAAGAEKLIAQIEAAAARGSAAPLPGGLEGGAH